MTDSMNITNKNCPNCGVAPGYAHSGECNYVYENSQGASLKEKPRARTSVFDDLPAIGRRAEEIRKQESRVGGLGTVSSEGRARWMKPLVVFSDSRPKMTPPLNGCSGKNRAVRARRAKIGETEFAISRLWSHTHVG
jgi:hypothetical protein